MTLTRPAIYRAFGTKLCELLGLDPDRTVSVTLRFEPGCVVLAEAVMHVEQAGVDEVIEELRRFHLSEIVDDEIVDDES